VKAPDAIEIDTTPITVDEQVDEAIRLALGKMFQPVKRAT
jgi:cytidylate kinase